MRQSPPPQRLVHLLAVTGNDDRWVFTRSYGPGDATDPALTELIRHLADLAWADDLPEGRIIVQPRRYDLGPDPYARYRK